MKIDLAVDILIGISFGSFLTALCIGSVVSGAPSFILVAPILFIIIFISAIIYEVKVKR